MLSFTPAPFGRITLIFCLGILTARYIDFQADYLFYTALIFYLPLIYFLKDKFYSNSIIIGLVGLFIVYTGGWVLYSKSIRRENPINSDQVILSSNQYLLWINKPLESTQKGSRGEATVLSYRIQETWINCDFKINIYFPGSDPPELESLILVKGHPDTIRISINNSGFDFKKYYALQGVYLTDYINKNSIITTRTKKITFYNKLAYRVRSEIEQAIDKHFKGSPSGAVLKALTIGKKNDLDPEVKENFSNSGTMHVLAVSGLHVGIFYGIFLLIFRRLFNSKWKFPVILFIVIQLWFYAIVTGLSPSVVRAVTMFSILALGKLMNRKSNPFNLVFASAFIILLFKPALIFSVGFQLSYLAVFSILFFSPRIIRWQPLWMPAHIWTLLAVSVAAQIGTLPLSLYYFKQFPTYFLLSNLMVIPAVFLILNAGILFITVGFLDPVQSGISYILDKFISMMLLSVELINKLPLNIIKTKIFDGSEVLLLYLLIGSLSAFWLKRTYAWLLGSLVTVLIFFIARVINIWTYYH